MKKMLALIILIVMFVGCADIMASRERMRERGYECFYNEKGQNLGCNYIN